MRQRVNYPRTMYVAMTTYHGHCSDNSNATSVCIIPRCVSYSYAYWDKLFFAAHGALFTINCN